MDTTLLIIFFVIDLIAIAMLSASEVAIASFGANKIEEMEERGEKLTVSFKKIQANPEAFFGTLQVSTTLLHLINVVITFLLAGYYSETFLSDYGIGLINQLLITFFISISISSFFILTCGILIPKALGFKYSDSIGRKSVKTLLLLSALMYLPVKYVTFVSNLFLMLFRERTNFSQSRLSEDEIRIILSEGVKSGAIDKTEHEIINNIFEFTDLRANEVMIPRTDMIAIDISEQNENLVNEVLKSGHSVIPAFEETSDNIVGSIHTKDLMKVILSKDEIDFKKLIRPVYFIPETKLISEILKEMQKRGERLAIVTDEYGGTEGVITMEDIIEEIVGKLGDNTKSELPEYNRLKTGEYYVLGSMFIEDFNEVFNINLPESDEYNTVSGFVAYRSGRILNPGDKLEFEELNFELIKKLRQKMVQFKVYSTTKNFSESVKE
ncbi:MAG: HlyC/CorC family transporter [Ignavibacteriales bacterium]|nr:MAG: HlyC/CorC family transporter [Ignavibacteriales bacterium]